MAQSDQSESPTTEELAIAKVREKILDVILADRKFDDDFYLLQWLKAQKMNADKAEEMIRKSIKWRQEQNIHSNLEGEFSQDFIKDFRIASSKTKDGIPIAYLHAGKMDFKKGVTICGPVRWNQYWGMIYSKMEDLMVEFNKNKNIKTTRLTSNSSQPIAALVDCKNFSTLQFVNLNVLRCSVQNVSALMNYFPAMFSTIIFYNMGAGFKLLLSTIKPLLIGPNLTVEVYGPGDKAWLDRKDQFMHEQDFNELESRWQ